MIKKILSILLAVAAFPAAMLAQTTMSYDATVKQGSYEEITDGTAVPLGGMTTRIDTAVFDGTGTPHVEAFSAEGYPIGFDFKFNGKLMKQFLIGGRGYLALGNQDGMAATCQTYPYQFFSSEGDTAVVGVMYRSHVAAMSSTEISYKTEGTAPDRQLTVQYKDLQLWVEGWDGDEIRDTVSLQIRLHESGEIEMVFKGFEPSAQVADEMNYNDGFKIGIRGTGEDRLLKKDDFVSDAFDTSDGNILLWSATSYPADGTVYSFLPPEDCAAPTSQPTDLQLTSTSLCVDGSFTAAEADHYLVTIDQDETPATLPADGVFYEKGDSIGSSVVIDYTTATQFSSGDILTEATQYYIHVFATNSFCFYAPKYNTIEPLTLGVSTCPAAPAAIEVVATDSTEISLKLTANSANDDVIVAYTTEPKQNNYGQTITGGTFGVPAAAEYAVGDSITGGGLVAYTGKVGQSVISLTGLQPGKVHHFIAWSKNAEGLYSSTSTTVSTVTAGTEPWSPDFSSYVDDGSPVGWGHDGAWTVYTDRTTGETSVYLYVSTGDAINGIESWIETPDIYLAQGENRVVLDLLMTEWVNRTWTTYTMHDKDTICVQATTDGKTYQTIASYTSDNPLEFKSSSESLKLYIPFTEGAGKKARLRLWCRVYGKPKIYIMDALVEEKMACDYPINVMVPDSCIVGNEAVAYWTPQGDEDAWDVRYKQSSSDTWSDIITVREAKVTLTGLAAITPYDIEVRAHCSATEHSSWSETCSFTSGLSTPFSMAFAELEELPSTWQMKQGQLATPTELTDGGYWKFRSSYYGTYMYYEARSKAADDWLITPMIELGEDNVNSLVDISITNNASAEATDATLQLVVAADGTNFNADDVVLTITNDDMPEEYESKTYTASLKGYSGKVRLGLYMHSSDGTPAYVLLDTLSLRYSCPNDVEAVVDTIGNDTAHVSWTSAADEWLVYCRESGNTDRNFTKTSVPEFGFGQLKQFTTYEIGITKTCEPGDTAKVQTITFTTTGTLCAEPTNIDVTPGKYSAKMSWSGDAAQYNVRYRVKAEPAAEWTIVKTDQTQMELADLSDGTEYEYSLQSICGTEASDTSAYTPVGVFVTLVETCMKPENVVVTPSWNKAEVTWTGEADKYQVAYRKNDNTEWTLMETPNGGCTIEDLTPETAYKLRMRAICAEGDSSLWTSVVDFTTMAEPECVTPTNLEASSLTESSAILTWQADQSNISWNLRYRESIVAEWTELENLADTCHQLTGLKANTAYVWRVQAVCEEERSSKWASQSKFTTTMADGIDRVGISNIGVFASGGILNIVNPGYGQIDTITVCDAAGRVIVRTSPRTRDNVFLNLAGVKGNIIVKVYGQHETKTFKLAVR